MCDPRRFKTNRIIIFLLIIIILLKQMYSINKLENNLFIKHICAVHTRMLCEAE